VNILITGASGQIARFMLPLLVRQGHACLCISRNEHADSKGVHWIRADLHHDMTETLQLEHVDVWIHLAILPLAIAHMELAASIGVYRFIAFSSTSIYTKQTSDNREEKRTIEELTEAASSIQSLCQQYKIAWTLFRPTMIYGSGMDQNITFIQQVIQRFGFFPVAGVAKGLRQPVHAGDLASACVAVLDQEQSMNKAYNLSGGEILSYQEMVKRIFCAMNRSPRVVRLPVPLYKGVIHLLKRVSGRYAFVHPSMVGRMNMNMVFDHSDATNDFGYKPRQFQP